MNWLDTCKQTAVLLSQREDEPLGVIARWRLRAHLSVCENCRGVEAQLQSLRTLTRQWLSPDPNRDPPDVP